MQLRDRLQRVYRIVRTNFQRTFARQKTHYDRTVHGEPFTAGDLVWLHSPVVGAGRSKKLHRLWTGPYRILKRLSEQVYRVQSTSGAKKRLVMHFNRLKPYRAHGPEESGDSPRAESPIIGPSNIQLHNFGEQLQVIEGNPPAVTLPCH